MQWKWRFSLDGKQTHTHTAHHADSKAPWVGMSGTEDNITGKKAAKF